MKFKEYTEKEFERWCEDYTIEDNFGLWDFIKDQEVILEYVDEEDTDVHLIVKIKLQEV